MRRDAAAVKAIACGVVHTHTWPILISQELGDVSHAAIHRTLIYTIATHPRVEMTMQGRELVIKRTPGRRPTLKLDFDTRQGAWNNLMYSTVAV